MTKQNSTKTILTVVTIVFAISCLTGPIFATSAQAKTYLKLLGASQSETKTPEDRSSDQVRLPASRKIYIETNGDTTPENRQGFRVPFREISLTPSKTMDGSIEENLPVRVYDTSGPWTDPDQKHNITDGLPALRRRVRGGGGAASDQRLRRWSIALGVALLLWLPWLPSLLVQVRHVDAEFWIPPPTVRSVAATWRDFVSAFVPGGWLLALILLAFGGIALLGVWRLRRRPALLALLLLLIVVPFAGELLVSLRRPIYYTRTLIWASIPFYLLLALGLLQLRFRLLIGAATLALVLLNGVSLVGYYYDYEPEGWRDAATWLAPQVRAGDIILFNAGWTQIPFDYYYRQIGPPVEERGLPADLFDRGILEPKMATADLPRLAKLVAGRRRVWLVYSHSWYTDPQRIIPRYLDVALDKQAEQAFNGLDIFIYE